MPARAGCVDIFGSRSRFGIEMLALRDSGHTGDDAEIWGNGMDGRTAVRVVKALKDSQ